MPASPLVIITVLKSGGEYRAEHVERLAAQCERWAPGVGFACLSDVELPSGISRIALEQDYPGWWSKIEAFRVVGPVLYMDLDTSIVGPLSPLLDVARAHKFVALRDFNPHQREMGSGLMSWSESMGYLYKQFHRDPQGIMRRCSTPRHWGDQGYIEKETPGRAYWQDLLPGAVVSFKKHCARGIPTGARVVCFHGKPRPWEVGQ